MKIKGTRRQDANIAYRKMKIHSLDDLHSEVDHDLHNYDPQHWGAGISVM